MIEDEMVGWHHRLSGHEFEQALGIGDGQGSPYPDLNSLHIDSGLVFLACFDQIKDPDAGKD